MDFFDKLNETLSSTGKTMAEKAKNISDIAAVKRGVLAEEQKLDAIYRELGRSYFQRRGSSPDPDFSLLCGEASLCISKVEEGTRRLRDLRGLCLCPSCGAEVDAEMNYCGICGQRMNRPEPFSQPDGGQEKQAGPESGQEAAGRTASEDSGESMNGELSDF